MRLAFLGTPAFAAPTLAALAAAGHDIAAVYAQPPRPAGRGKKPRPGAVAALALERGFPLHTPRTLRDPAEQAAFAALGLDAAVVVAYGLILPRPILDAPRLGCFNLHGSLLPRWRGAAPVQRAIMAGDAETGVCVMRMDAGLDTGPVGLVARAPIHPEDDAGALADRLAALGAPLMVEALALAEAGMLTLTPQPAEGACYAAKIDKAEARIDWTQDAETVDRAIRGLTPNPGAWTEFEGERLKVLKAHPDAGEGAPGVALDDALLVACGRGALRIDVAQRPGRAAMGRDDLLRGRPVPAGARFV
ncbi:MAG: methionyl-tRNA formyltransferase [Rhodobacteraceae bacterium]|nr:MAG: methionyl-tRNA formyltransferase [Paracoccaceae bacterium]